MKKFTIKKTIIFGLMLYLGIFFFGGNAQSALIGDLNNSGKVDIADYSMFIQDFGKTGTNLAADLNKNGQVEIGDYSIFISNFGKIAPVDTQAPTITAFNISPGSVKVSWKVQDAGGSYLDRVEVWRTADVSGRPGSWGTAPVGVVNLKNLNLSSHDNTSNPYIDNPESGTWWYGIHVVDQAGNVSVASDFNLGPKSIIISSPVETNLIFRSGYEANSTQVGSTMNDIIGIDLSVPAPNDWVNHLEKYSFNGSYLSSFGVSYNSAGSYLNRYAKLVPDPVNPSNQVLMFFEKEAEYRDDGTYSRVQSVLSGKMKEVGFRMRMYIHPDNFIIEKHPDNVGYMITELWPRPGWVGANYPFRISLYIRKEPGAGMPLYWYVRGAQHDSPVQERLTYWEFSNKNIPVPKGEWFTLEYYYKGGNETNGRFIYKIKKDGQTQQTVFDVTNWTYHPKDVNDGVDSMHIQKLYPSPDLSKFVLNNGGIMRHYYDDLQVWAGYPGK